MRYPEWLRVDPDNFDLSKIDTRDRRGPDGSKLDREVAEHIHRVNVEEMKALQYQMWAEHKHKLLVVFQALDTGGKDGAIRRTFGELNPQGVRTHAFKRPTELELDHDFLWRVHQNTPKSGHIQIFNRSHYEDVLVVRVHNLVPEERWRKRYEHIRSFERMLADEGTMVLKFFLHISREEQKNRLQARLDDPQKHWKFEMGDLKERAKWDAYQEAFQEAIMQTSTTAAPWYVIPADRKWYRDFALSSIVHSLLKSVDMRWPAPAEGLEKVVIPD